MTLEIATNAQMTGAVNLVPYIAFGGLKWSRNDINGTSAGRTLDGVMHVNRIASKVRLDITFRQLSNSEMQTIQSLLYGSTLSNTVNTGEINGYFWVTYDDPRQGRREKIKMYSNNISSPVWMMKNGVTYWDKFSAPLIEV